MPDAGGFGAGPGTTPDDTGEFLLKHVVAGKRDMRNQYIEEVLRIMPEYRIYRTCNGISAHYSDNAVTANVQDRRFLALGQDLAHLNHLVRLSRRGLRRGIVWLYRRIRHGEDAAKRSGSSPYDREICRGIAQALTGDVDDGKATLGAAAKRAEKRLCNRGRVSYFTMCLILAAAILGVAAFVDGAYFDLKWSEVALVASVGSIGALLSTVVGLRKLIIDATESGMMNYIYGVQRMLVGVLGAIVLYIALKAGVATELLPAAAATTGDGSTLDPYKLAFVSILAGFSERLVPNLLERSFDTNGGGNGTPAASN